MGSKTSKKNKELDGFLKEYREKAIYSVSNNLIGIIKRGDCYEILMEASRIISEFPDHYKIIIFEAKNDIFKNTVIFYFLSKMLKMDQPVLSKDENKKVKMLEKQFGFFLG